MSKGRRIVKSVVIDSSIEWSPPKSKWRKILDEMKYGDSVLLEEDGKKKLFAASRGQPDYNIRVRRETHTHWRCWKIKIKQEP